MGRQNETWRNSAYLENHNSDYDGNYIEGRVFVGMAFDVPSDISDEYQAIKRACKKVGLETIRVDDIPGSGPIPMRVIREIENAEFIIFDLSKERPNVYYELGYAHGVGNREQEILLIAKEGSNVHFDVAQLASKQYKSATELERMLPALLREMIRITRK